MRELSGVLALLATVSMLSACTEAGAPEALGSKACGGGNVDTSSFTDLGPLEEASPNAVRLKVSADSSKAFIFSGSGDCLKRVTIKGDITQRRGFDISALYSDRGERALSDFQAPLYELCNRDTAAFRSRFGFPADEPELNFEASKGVELEPMPECAWLIQQKIAIGEYEDESGAIVVMAFSDLVKVVRLP